MEIRTLRQKKIAMLGLGVEGLATALYLLEHKIAFSVVDEKSKEMLREVGPEWDTLIDRLQKSGINLILGKPFDVEVLKKFDVIIRSPGISPLREVLIQTKEQGVFITSQTKIFFDNCPCKIVGVTGTKGKGTTSSLIYEMLKKGGIDAYLGGNIGRPPIEFLDTLTPQSIVVLEMSSFQLMDLEESPHVSVMLMVTSEHLDVHKDTQEYVEAKRNIVRFQTAGDMAILNIDYEATRESASHTNAQVAFISRYKEVETGCFVRNNKVILRTSGQETEVIDSKDILLPGAHNLENICAAVMAAYFLGASIPDIAFVLGTFKGLQHRLELVREIHGVRYYDDSFSTVPETAIAAISAFAAPEIVILGGSSKNSDFSELGKLLSGPTNVKAVIGIGVEWSRIKSQIPSASWRTKSPIKIVEGLKTMEEVVKKAAELAEPGDVVLLSPACASFDMFKNYKDRGNQFKHAVSML